MHKQLFALRLLLSASVWCASLWQHLMGLLQSPNSMQGGVVMRRAIAMKGKHNTSPSCHRFEMEIIPAARCQASLQS